jgi:hypothetical protein
MCTPVPVTRDAIADEKYDHQYERKDEIKR